MKKRQLVKWIAASLAIGASAIGFQAQAQSKMVLKASDVHPLGYPTVEAIVRMGKKLEAATNGRISIQMFPSMQLGGEKEMIEQAQIGALQIARISVGSTQLLVGPASSFLAEQINVLSSTRATSSGSERAKNEFLRLLGFKRLNTPALTKSSQNSSYSAWEPSHH